MHHSIHPATHMGPLALRVASLARSLPFYQDTLGFQRLTGGEGAALLGVADRPLLLLQEQAGAAPARRGSTGLYHVAVLLPSRATLGHVLRRLIDAQVPLGHSDHLVSEALYLSDPDGNGIELYRDRPREGWQWAAGQVRMALDPADLEGILAAGEETPKGSESLPPGTTIGHVHLKVGDLAHARAFYHELLRFDLTSTLPGALFMAAGGYHHHLGLNIWESRGGAAAPPSSAGLHRFSVVLPDEASLDSLRESLDAQAHPYRSVEQGLFLADPWQNRLLVTHAPDQEIAALLGQD